MRGILPHSILLQHKPIRIAEALTYLDLDLYKKLQADEFFSWNADVKKLFSPNAHRLMERNEKLRLWTSTTILTQEKLADRIAVTKRLITIANHLLNLKNYHTLMGLLMGLNTVSVQKLVTIFRGLSRKSTEKFKSLTTLTQPDNHWGKLRLLMSEGCLLPYIGLYINKLSQIIEREKDYIMVGPPTTGGSNGSSAVTNKLINIPKFHALGQVVSSIFNYQDNVKFYYQYEEPIACFLWTLPHLQEKELDKLSKQLVSTEF
eukprot:TRINITY_DN18391_c0_g1_i1.p1 TRINITY_DN18391_c0_g1~~TRINITY_DN18391_c0_g1_i1.p1  ORF type:complete len:261 (+),score=27.63 TRINITY_DN18391_c0_g1_i1:147-929(+)